MRVKTQDKCSIWWCDRAYYAKGYCHTHWTANQRFGSPYGRHQKELERIDDIIEDVRLLLREINYPPGPTRYNTIWKHAKEIEKTIGKGDVL